MLGSIIVTVGLLAVVEILGAKSEVNVWGVISRKFPDDTTPN